MKISDIKTMKDLSTFNIESFTKALNDSIKISGRKEAKWGHVKQAMFSELKKMSSKLMLTLDINDWDKEFKLYLDNGLYLFYEYKMDYSKGDYKIQNPGHSAMPIEFVFKKLVVIVDLPGFEVNLKNVNNRGVIPDSHYDIEDENLLKYNFDYMLTYDFIDKAFYNLEDFIYRQVIFAYSMKMLFAFWHNGDFNKEIKNELKSYIPDGYKMDINNIEELKEVLYKVAKDKFGDQVEIFKKDFLLKHFTFIRWN